MGLFNKLFNKQKPEPIHYKEKLENKMGETDLDLPAWLQELVFSVIEEEEQKRTYEEMVSWLENWSETGRLPKELDKESILSEIYHNHRQWVEDTAQFYHEIIEDSDIKIMKEEFGEPYASMSHHAQLTYFALFGEVMNAFAQIHWK